MDPRDSVLARMDRARTLLAGAKSARDAKQISDMAHAALEYAKRQRLGDEIIQHANTIKVDALTLMGEFLEKAPKAIGAAAGGKKSGPRGSFVAPRDSAPTITSLGITKKTSSQGKFLATLKREEPKVHAAVRIGEKTITAARREISRVETKEQSELPSGKYRVFYADPPWKYGDQLTESYGATRFHYPSMSIAELCSMPVAAMAEDDAVLFLWVTSPMLEECFPVIKAWGFKYKASFVWDKVRHNMGHYNSVRHELLLICTRGSCTPDVKELVDSVVAVERTGRHSEKPEEFRQIIDKLYPNGSRVELFARKETTGWVIHGNQA